jgi:hypothetical protein
VSSRIKRTPSIQPHPLEGLVMAAFESSPAHDRVTIAVRLCGHAPPHRAYLKVAEDVLGYMKGQGKLRVDDEGWHRLGSVAGANADHMGIIIEACESAISEMEDMIDASTSPESPPAASVIAGLRKAVELLEEIRVRRDELFGTRAEAN